MPSPASDQIKVSALGGRRVIVTRAAHQASALVRLLRAEGATPIVVPAISTEPCLPDEPVRRGLAGMDRIAWLVWTSRNGVEYGWPVLDEVWPAGLPKGVRVAAVGPGTADELVKRGLSADFVPTEHLAAALGNELPVAAGDHVVLFRGDLARPDLPEILAGRGASVTDIVVYRTVSGASADAVRDALAGSPDAITFTSASTVEGFARAVRELETTDHWPSGVRTVAIGPVTAAAMQELSIPVDAIAEPHTLSGLVAALLNLYQVQQDP